MPKVETYADLSLEVADL